MLVKTTPTSTWTSYSYNDNSWDDYNGNDYVYKEGTVYVRQKFTGLSNMAAYELTFYQQYGLIIYINGNEIYRNNMPEGSVTANTPCNGHYEFLYHHSVIRNGLEIEGDECVVAMEYHYEDNTSSHTFRIGGFLSPYAADVGEDCYQSYETFSVTSSSSKEESDANSPSKIFDLDPSTSWIEDTTSKWVQITWSRWIPQINGFYINTYGARNLHPTDFTLLGGITEYQTSLTTIVAKKDVEYDLSSQTTYFNLVLNTQTYKKIRMQITKTGDSSLRFNELGLLTCRYSVPDKLELTESKVDAIAFTTEVKIAPIYDGFTSCSVSPTLPSGLSISSTTCIISGRPTVDSEEKTYTVTSTTPKQSSATFTLKVDLCEKTIVEIERTYGSAGYVYETHSLRSNKDSSIVERVTQNSIQKASTTMKTRYCVDAGLYELSVNHITATAWNSESYININQVHGTDTTTIVHWRYDLDSGYASSVTIQLGYAIPRSNEWYYTFGDLPSGWNNGEMPSGWQKAKKGDFPPSTNQLQLYKQKFTLTDDPVGSGFEMELRYNYGIIVHINGIEVFRNHITDEVITNTTVASTTYPNLIYRRISLPVIQAAQGDKPQQTVIHKGDNVVSILVVARSSTQTGSTFDASLRMFGRETVGRVFDYSVSATDSSVTPNYLFDLTSSTVYSSSSCSESRYVQIAFNDDRREWISKYTFISAAEDKPAPYTWLFQAMNDDDDDWTTLDTITSSSWWGNYQIKEMWVLNNKPYNRYRVTNIGAASSSDCSINLIQVGLFSDSLTRPIPEFDYIGSTTGYISVDFADLIPNSDYFSHFTVTPDLPYFLSLDYVTGIIRGSQASSLSATDYTITAQKLDGTQVTKVLTISVISCDKAMTTVVIRTDSWPKEMQWYLYEGSSATGEPIVSVEGLEYQDRYVYKYLCLEKGVYTAKFQDTFGDGWNAPAGYKIMVSGNTVAFGGVPRSSEKPAFVTRTFSTNIMIPLNSPEWRFLKQSPPANWNSPSFDHSVWNKITGGDAGKYEAKTNYFRHEFTIPSLTTYPVLNVAVSYGAGIIGYLNGNMVYRSNLPRDAAFETSASNQRSSTSAIEFSIPLQLKGGVQGKNILAFELHRTAEMSSSENNGFNAYAILASGDCAIVRNDVAKYEYTKPVGGAGSYLFDTSTYNYISWDWTPETYFSWEYENLEGMLFNQYRFYADGNAGALSWTMTSMKEDDEIYKLFDTVKDTTIPDRSRSEYKVPNGIIGYNKFKVNFNSVANPSGFTIDEIEFAYCPYSASSTCPGVDEYPMTGEGEISVSICPDFYEGYSYRECHNGRLGEVKLDKCSKLPPTKVEFNEPMFIIYVGIPVTTIVPKVFGLVDDYQIMPPLPEGLTFDRVKGTVGGAALNTTSTVETYTVTAYNEKGSASGTFQLKIIEGYCEAEDEFPRTTVGTTYEYDCKEKGKDYYGTLKRTCKVGAEGPEWSKVSGMCLTKGSFTALSILLVVVVIIVILAIIKVIRDKSKAKARSGVRGGKKSRNIMKSVPYAKI